jgi:SAM-dependent methyltransferase
LLDNYRISGKKALEIGCGSGHSIIYMINKGIDEIWGIDLSAVQIQTAQTVCGQNGKVKLLESSMEEDSGIPHGYFDIVYSIYALGWTLDLRKTLQNIHSYLKPGGTFIFSWEHPIHSRVILENETVRFNTSYNYEKLALHEAWKPRSAVFLHRKLSTYLNDLIDTGFIIEKVLEEVNIDRETKNDNSWYSSIKAGFFPATFIIKCKRL